MCSFEIEMIRNKKLVLTYQNKASLPQVMEYLPRYKASGRSI